MPYRQLISMEFLKEPLKLLTGFYVVIPSIKEGMIRLNNKWKLNG
jgi:hypothetical protein